MKVLVSIILFVFWIGMLFAQTFSPDLKNTIKQIYNGHEIIGIGEASHGTKSIYKFREFFVKTCIEEKEPVSVLVEMPQGVEYLIQDFYDGKIDTLSFLNGVQFYGLQTDAFLEFVQAFKNHPQVSIIGIDMQNQALAVDRIEKYLKTKLPTHKDTLDSLIEPIRSASVKSMKNTSNKDSLKDVYNNYYKNLNLFVKTKEEQLGDDNGAFCNLYYPMRTVEQFLQFTFEFQKGWISNFFRDSCMASNVLVYKRQFKEKVIIIGANLHIGKSPKLVGNILDKEFNEKYFAIGEQFFSGSVLVANFKTGHYLHKTQCSKKSLPARLNKFYEDTLLVFSNIKEPKIKRVMNRYVLIQDFGVGHNLLGKNFGLEYAVPSKIYDAIYFFTKIESSKSLVPLRVLE